MDFTSLPILDYSLIQNFKVDEFLSQLRNALFRIGFFFLSSKEIVDGRELETSLKQFLIDQSKAQEREIEELIKNVGESYLMENSIDGEEKIEYGDTLDLKLRDLKPGNEKIDDIYIWKSNMQLGPAPTPVITLNDLTSKL